MVMRANEHYTASFEYITRDRSVENNGGRLVGIETSRSIHILQQTAMHGAPSW